MANYPNSLDSLTNPEAGESRASSPSEVELFTLHNDILEALEAKVGIGTETAAAAATGEVLTKQADGTTAWQSGTNITLATGGTSAALQAALDACEAAGGGRVIAAAAPWTISTQVNIPTTVELDFGTKYGAIATVTADVIGFLLEAPGKNGLKNAHVVSGVATTKPGVQVGDGVTATSNFEVENVYITRSSGSNKFDIGLLLTGALSGRVSGLLVDSTITANVKLVKVTGQSTPNAIRFSDSNLANGGTYGVWAVEAEGCRFDGVTVQGNTTNGYYLDTCTAIDIASEWNELTASSSVGVNLVGCSQVNVYGGRMSTETDLPVKIRTSGSTMLIGVQNLVLDVDTGSADTKVIAGSLAAGGLTNELGTRTQLIGVSKSGTGTIRAIENRTNGALIPAATDTRWIPAEAFVGIEGSPALSSQRNWRAWFMDAASTERIAATVALPQDWTTFDVDLWWSNPAGGTGNIVHSYDVDFVINTGTVTSSSSTGVAAVAFPAEDVIKVSTLVAGVSATASAICRVVVGRTGGDAADTGTLDSSIIGVLLRKVT